MPPTSSQNWRGKSRSWRASGRVRELCGALRTTILPERLSHRAARGDPRRHAPVGAGGRDAMAEAGAEARRGTDWASSLEELVKNMSVSTDTVN